MKFKMKHLFFNNTATIIFDQEHPPDWLLNKECKWWWDKHVKKLAVGQSIKSDFQYIERIE